LRSGALNTANSLQDRWSPRFNNQATGEDGTAIEVIAVVMMVSVVLPLLACYRPVKALAAGGPAIKRTA